MLVSDIGPGGAVIMAMLADARSHRRPISRTPFADKLSTRFLWTFPKYNAFFEKLKANLAHSERA
jgi:hypothetical protein